MKLRRNTTSKGCRPAFMAARENAARPANSTMAMVTQTMPATGPLRAPTALSRGAKTGMVRRSLLVAGAAGWIPRYLFVRAQGLASPDARPARMIGLRQRDLNSGEGEPA